jgi:hypothetical protein
MLKTFGSAAVITGLFISFPVFAQTADETFVKEQSSNQWRSIDDVTPNHWPESE